mgnify:CR=1 FL=1
MNEYSGVERRRDCLNMEGRLAVLESQILDLKEGKNELDNDLKALTSQINSLNVQLPTLINSINSLESRIILHEGNAQSRGEEIEKHKIKCGTIYANVRNIWAVIGFIFAIIGVLIAIMFKMK